MLVTAQSASKARYRNHAGRFEHGDSFTASEARWVAQEESGIRGRTAVAAKYTKSDLAVAEAAEYVVVHHPGGLHVGIDDCRPRELEAAVLEILADRVGQRCPGRQL
jgi:hypothetical protein